MKGVNNYDNEETIYRTIYRVGDGGGVNAGSNGGG